MKPSDVRRARKRNGHVSKLYRRRAQFTRRPLAETEDRIADQLGGLHPVRPTSGAMRGEPRLLGAAQVLPASNSERGQ